MLKVTDRAAAELQVMLVTKNAPPGYGVKLVPGDTAGAIGMMISEPSEGDDVIRRGDEPLLIVDGRMADALEGAEIDCETTVIEGQPMANFKLRPPPPSTK